MKKVIIFGYTKTGREIATLIRDDSEYDLEIIDENPLQVAEANEDGFFAHHSTLKDDDILHEIGIGKDVITLFCVSNDDSLNLFVTLSARSIDKNLKILTLVKRKEDEKKMLLAGANRTISPHGVGAIKAFRIIQKPKVTKVLEQFTRLSNKLSITEIEIPKGSILDGIYFRDMDCINDSNLIFLGILDKELGEEFIFFSKGVNHKIDSGDILVVLGSKKDIKAFEKRILPQ